MYMSDKLFKASELNPLDKLVLAYILRGHYRQKYISLETFAKELYQSQPSISKSIKRLEALELVKWVKVQNNKYKIIIVCQKAFNKYAFLNKDEIINEKQLTKDNVINTLAEMERQKDLITFDKKAFKDNEKKIRDNPSWYNDYKNNTPKEQQTFSSEEEYNEMKKLVDTIF